LVRFLEEEGYATVVAGDGWQAIELVHRVCPDVIILDVNMPGMDGYETCRYLKGNPRTALVPVTMLTGTDDQNARVLGIEAGADEFLAKPFDHATLRARVRGQLRVKRATDQLERTEAVIFSMARWVELRDRYTEAHLRRVAGYSEQVAEALGLSAEDRLDVRYAGILHDIGKIAVPDAIIHKPGPLTPDEERAVQEHSAHGAAIIAPMRFAPRVAPIIRAHHEHWDGRGYPDRLAGGQIPLGARIIAVVDAWDAMTTDRSYRSSLDADEASRRLLEGSGTQWDQQITELFVRLHARRLLTPIDLPETAAAATETSTGR
jgi:putative two-component system response regulator